MPFKPAEVAKCPKCSKAVYAAEEKIAGGHKWHKGCFKCSLCNKFLDSTSSAEHDGQLFCKTCHGRKFGPKGYGFGGGAAGLTMDNGEQFGNTDFVTNGHPKSTSNGLEAPEGQGCPRCNCFVYHADQIFSKNQVWHKQCFKCRTCHRSLDSRSACDGPDKEVYCTACYRKGFGLKGYGFGQGGPALLSADVRDGSGPEQSTSLRFIDTSLIPAEGGPGCPRCGGKVFHAEQMFSKNKTYHKRCFSCKSCKRPLDSVLACDAPDDDIYCRGSMPHAVNDLGLLTIAEEVDEAQDNFDKLWSTLDTLRENTKELKHQVHRLENDYTVCGSMVCRGTSKCCSGMLCCGAEAACCGDLCCAPSAVCCTHPVLNTSICGSSEAKCEDGFVYAPASPLSSPDSWIPRRGEASASDTNWLGGVLDNDIFKK